MLSFGEERMYKSNLDECVPTYIPVQSWTFNPNKMLTVKRAKQLKVTV